MPATAGDLETDPEIAAHELAIETLRAGITVRRERIAAEKATAKAGRRSATNDEAGSKNDAPVTRRGRPRSEFPDHYNLRLRLGDRERFDEYAYRHRMMKGELFGRMLDAIEAIERAKKGTGNARKK